MAPNYILYAIPVFFLMILLEASWCAYKKLPYYRFNDSINDLSMGVSQQVLGGFMGLFGLGLYVLTYDHLRVFSLPESHPATWILAFLAYDFCYYWLHRSSHHINILWGGHAPHHSSEEYNLAVALRQGLFQSPLTIPFYLPMGLLGIPPLVYFSVGQLNTIYQFWIHTRIVGKMGFLEFFLNTPSHHRVHHGKNLRYIDMNHAGMFIIWDKLFGTFVPEQEEPVYGTIEPLASWNPMWGQCKFLIYLFERGWRSDKWSDLLRIWFMPAGWTPQTGLKPYQPDERSEAFLHRWDPPMPTGIQGYVALQFALTTGLGVVFLILAKKVPLTEATLLAFQVTLGLTTLGGLMEGRRWAFWLELARWLSLVPLLFLYQGTSTGLVGLGVAVVCVGWLSTFRPQLQAPALITVAG